MLYTIINLKLKVENELDETHWRTSRAGQAIVSTSSLDKESIVSMQQKNCYTNKYINETHILLKSFTLKLTPVWHNL